MRQVIWWIINIGQKQERSQDYACGTLFPSITTVWVLFDRRADIQLRDYPVIP